MRPRHRLALALIPVLVTSCASEEPQSAVAQAREVRPVDPDTDNRAVTSQLTPGLVIQLEIDRNTVRLADAQLVLVPRQTRQGREGERVIVSGWRGGQQVTTVSIPDQRINSQENVGIVIREQRTLSVALPLPPGSRRSRSPCRAGSLSASTSRRSSTACVKASPARSCVVDARPWRRPLDLRQEMRIRTPAAAP
jgi:hypothetical protein